MMADNFEFRKLIEELGLNRDQILELKKAFDSFDCDKKGAICAETTGQILQMMGVKVSSDELQSIMDDIDVDKSGYIEFNEFATLSARFLGEEDEENLRQELREAFRIYDKEENGFITIKTLKEVDEDESGTVDLDEFME